MLSDDTGCQPPLSRDFSRQMLRNLPYLGTLGIPSWKWLLWGEYGEHAHANVEG